MKYFFGRNLSYKKTNQLKIIKMSSTTTQTFSMPTTVQEANVVGVSLCIPRVFNNINHRRIKEWFIKNLRQWGFIERVDLVPVFKQGKQVYKRAYIHYAPGRFNMGVDDGQGNNILDSFIAGDTIQVVYDEPWFWKLSLSRSERPLEAPKPYSKPTISIHRAEEKVAEDCGCKDGACDTCVAEALDPMTPHSFGEEEVLSDVLEYLRDQKVTSKAPKLERQVCKDLH